MPAKNYWVILDWLPIEPLINPIIMLINCLVEDIQISIASYYLQIDIVVPYC